MNREKESTEMQPSCTVCEMKARRKRITKITAACVLALLANLLFFFMIWLIKRYDDVQFDQILYQIKSPVAGTAGGIVGSAMLEVVLVGVLAFALETTVYVFLTGRFKDKLSKFGGYVKYSATRVAAFFKKRYMPIAAGALVLSMLIFIFRLGIHSFVANIMTPSDFIKDNYVDPDEINISFPEENKRNLVYVFLESMENTFSDTGVGGNITADFTPELSELRENNISFSSHGGRYGAYSYVGTRWTAAAMFSQTSGVPIKVPLNFDTYGRDGTYMPGITTLGDILMDAGYEQSILLGSDAGFAARDAYFAEHGNYNIIDIYSLIEEGRLPENYWEWWGFEDAKVFEFAKEEITRLAESGKPFNFTTLTADTHFPDGYLCEKCGDEYEEQYSNVLACSSRQVKEFLDWLRAQPYYENTTVILSGDHLTMDPEFLEDIDGDYIRTTYNCIINAAAQPVREDDREFGTFDMFPTTLAALGVTIEGNRLGLGTNLFSSEKTLTEIYGFDKLEEELAKRSDFYIDTFYDEETRKKFDQTGR